MAKQISLIKINGTLDNLNFYTTRKGNFVRMKSNLDALRLATDPAFIRSRETSNEFGMAAKAAKLFRLTLRSMDVNLLHGRNVASFNRLMLQIKEHDLESARGSRSVGKGIQTDAGKEILRGLDFNVNAPLKSILHNLPSLDLESGQFRFDQLKISRDLTIPRGATHVSFRAGLAEIDFLSGAGDLKQTNTVNLRTNAQETSFTLNPESMTDVQGTRSYLLKIEFYQEVNGKQYALNNGAFNALQVIEVA